MKADASTDDMATARVRPDALATRLGGVGLEFDDAGEPVVQVIIVDLDSPVEREIVTEVAAARAQAFTALTIGVAREPLTELARSLAAELDTTLVVDALHETSAVVVVRDLEAEISRIVQAVAANPRAALSAMRVLRSTELLSVADGLNIESAVYSMLLAGPEFARWRSGRPRVIPDRDSHSLTVDRIDDCLIVTLNRPGRSNAIDRFLRDELIDAFDLAIIDETITSVILRGAGESFSGGGDLDEFGSVVDVSAAHLIRLDRSVAMRVEQCRERVVAHLHGGCVGFGIEVPSFAARVTAAPDMFAQLPELAMGLIPGAGGTVGVTRRIGRWRTAYMLLSGARIDAATAHGWGLVDDIDVS